MSLVILVGTTDTLEVASSAAATLDIAASYIDAADATLVPSGGGTQVTAMTTATTTAVLAAPGASKVRSLKSLTIRNKHATLATIVTVLLDRSGTNYEIYSVTLLAGQTLEYEEGLGFYVPAAARTDRWVRVSGSDYVNATTGFTDITGLSVPVENGKTYNFEAYLINANNAATTGSRFGVNGPSLTGVRVAVLGSDAAAVAASGTHSGSATAVDTAASATTAGGGAGLDKLDMLSGIFTAGAAGTFILRGASEVAVAAGLTVRVGSQLHVWEPTG